MEVSDKVWFDGRKGKIISQPITKYGEEKTVVRLQEGCDIICEEWEIEPIQQEEYNEIT